ncbi:MAG: ATP-binding protein, partial [Bdellovibrionota bacterium]|nr:ATP-binding protein [Bdellovibrionota bacterium]
TIAIPLGILFTWTILAFLGKHKSSKYVLYGFTAIVTGGLIKFAHGVGFLPTNFLWKNGFYLGVVAQLLLFSLGLAHLINQLKQEALTKAKIISNLNKDLEEKVIRRTEQLKESLASINILMDNMAQSVFAINEGGIITEPVSKYSYDIFGEEIEGKSIWDTLLKDLNPKQNEHSTLVFVFSTCFGVDDLQWLMVKDTVPKKFHFYLNGKIKSLKTRMRPIYHNELLEKIMFIVEDVTEIEKLEADIKRQREESNLKIEKLQCIVSNSKDSLVTFFKESYDIVEVLEKNNTEKDEFLRSIHTLKGLSRLYGLNFLSSKIHAHETEIIVLYEKGSHKKDFEINKANHVGHLISALDDTLATVREIYGDLYDPNKKDFEQEGDTIEVHKILLKDTYNEVSELIEKKDYSPILKMIEKLSNINIKSMATNLKNIVINTAKKLDKEVDFHVVGDNSYLPQENIAILKESFIHLFTNSVDHGIEKQGELNITVKEKSDSIIITIKDNGRGINEAAVLKKALDQKILTEDEAENLNSMEIQHLIFRPSFSTRQNATETSGRGIGMDVVKKNIEKLGGTIQIEAGQVIGTTFVISLPHFVKQSA